MVFLFRLLKGLRVKAKHNTYLELKSTSIEEQERQLDFCTKFKTLWLRKCPIFFGGKRRKKFKDLTKCEKFQVKTITTGTFENFVLKSLVGFISGVFLTYIFFAFFVFQLNFTLSTATYISSILGSVLSLGLAFSSSVRCVVLMLLPQMFSKRGRQALVAYAFILVFTGPAKNTMRNMRILSETMACTQGKLKEAVKSLVELIKRPFYAIKDTVTQVTEKIKDVVEKMKALISSIKKSVLSIIGVIKNAFNWLNSVVGMCSKKVGTPFQRCMQVFEGAIDDCKVQLGSMLNWMCSVAYVASHLCYAVKVFDFVCELIDFVSDSIVVQTKKKLQEFMFQVRNIFYVRIEFSHSFSMSTEESKSLKEVTSGIMTEISQKTSAVFSFFDIMSFGFSFFFLWMVFQILNYRRKFMTNAAFDNRYITDKIIELDIKRTQLGRETILPLNIHERKKYAPISSIRLVQTEKKVIAKSAIFLALSTLKLSLQILADYCLYWILTMIRFHGQFQTHVDSPTSFHAQVDGQGMLSELYASVLNAFKPSNIKIDLDTGSCLPDPLPPDTMQYKQVATLMAIAWIICFTEPYGLRLRFVVMSYYHPERAQVRAVWLYNNIIRARGSFLKYARRQLRRKFAKGEDGIEEVSIIDRIRARCPLLRKIWKGKEFKACLLCGSLGSKTAPLVKCPRKNCVGLFCVDCYATLQNVCTICRLPIEYGDLSDISEERDSSEESISKRGKAKRSESSETSGELNLAEVLSHGESGSDLSYGYQYEERDPNEDIQVPLPHKDVEAQKPKDRVTIHDFSEKIAEDKKYSRTLAERTKSGIWGFIPDSEPMELRRRTHFPSYNQYMNQESPRLSGPTTPDMILSPSPKMYSKIKAHPIKPDRRPPSSLLSNVTQPFYEEKGRYYPSNRGMNYHPLKGNYEEEFGIEGEFEEMYGEHEGHQIYEGEEIEFEAGEGIESEEGLERDLEEGDFQDYEERDLEEQEFQDYEEREFVAGEGMESEEGLERDLEEGEERGFEEDEEREFEESQDREFEEGEREIEFSNTQNSEAYLRTNIGIISKPLLRENIEDYYREEQEESMGVVSEDRTEVGYEGEAEEIQEESEVFERKSKKSKQSKVYGIEKTQSSLKKNKKRNSYDGGRLLKIQHGKTELSKVDMESSNSYHGGTIKRPTSSSDTCGKKILISDILSQSFNSRKSSFEDKPLTYSNKPLLMSSIKRHIRYYSKPIKSVEKIPSDPKCRLTSEQEEKLENDSKSKNYYSNYKEMQSKMSHYVSYQERKMSLKKSIVNDGSPFLLNETFVLEEPRKGNLINKSGNLKPLKSSTNNLECKEKQTQPEGKVIKENECRIVYCQGREKKKPEMIKRWIDSGTYYQASPRLKPRPQKSFIDTFFNVINTVSDVFSRKSQPSGSNIMLLNKDQHVKIQQKQNVLREKEKNVWEKQVKKESNIWEKIFWGGNENKDDDVCSSSSSEMETSQSLPPLVRKTGDNTQPEDKKYFHDKYLRINEKQPFHRMVQKPTAPQMVFEEFKMHEN